MTTTHPTAAKGKAGRETITLIKDLQLAEDQGGLLQKQEAVMVRMIFDANLTVQDSKAADEAVYFSCFLSLLKNFIKVKIKV